MQEDGICLARELDRVSPSASALEGGDERPLQLLPHRWDLGETLSETGDDVGDLARSQGTIFEQWVERRHLAQLDQELEATQSVAQAQDGDLSDIPQRCQPFGGVGRIIVSWFKDQCMEPLS